jgi:hypothetical protein
VGERPWAFSDESERANTMLMAVVLISPGRAAAARTVMRSLLLPGQRRVHMAKEGARRQRAVLDVVSSIEGVATLVVRLRRPMGIDRVAGRRMLLMATLELLVERGVTYWTLEDVPPSQRSRDNDTIGHVLRDRPGRPELVYDHKKGHEDPMLWVADAVGWAAGAGGDWRRRIARVATIVELPS